MSIGQALRETRLELGWKQRVVAERAHISDSLLSEYEREETPVPGDMVSILVREYNHPRLYLQAVEEVTGGVYSSPWLDGPGIDLHRASVWAKAIEELQEAVEAARHVDVANRPDRIDDSRRTTIRESLMEALDARVAVDHYVGVICQEYGFSLVDVYREHRQKLESRGYIKPRTKKKAALKSR